MFTTNTMVGYYSIADKLYQAIKVLYGPINQTLYPYVAKEKNIQLYKKVLFTVVALNTTGVIIVFFFGELIFSLLFTQKIGVESIKVFHIFLIANLFAVPSILIGYPFLGALGHANFTNKSVIITSIYHIVGLAIIACLFEITIYNVSALFASTAALEFFIRIYGIKQYNLWKTT